MRNKIYAKNTEYIACRQNLSKNLHLHKTFVNLSVVRQCKKPTRKWHIWFLPTHKPMLKKPKEPFFPTLDKQN